MTDGNEILINNTNFHNTVDCKLLEFWSDNSLMKDPNQYFFVKKIEFYRNANDANKMSSDCLLIDLSSEEAAKKNVKFDKDNTSGIFGEYSFDSAEGALAMKRSSSCGYNADYASRVKFSLRMNDKHVLPKGMSYMVVTYRTNIADKILLKLSNLRDNILVLSPDVSVSNGKYVRSEPVNINIFTDPIQDFYGRFRRRWKIDQPYTICNIMCIAPPDESGVHYHSHFEILYVKEGTLNAYVATERLISERFVLNKGDMLMVNPDYAHNLMCKNSSVKVYSIKFLPEILCGSITSLSKTQYYILLLQKKLNDMPYFSKDELAECGLDVLISDIIKSIETKSFAYEVTVQSKLTGLFAVLLSKYCRPESVNVNVTATLTVAFKKAIDEARRNLYDFNTADAAKLCNLSYNYFCSNFKKCYGTSFALYLETLRLQESQRLLLTTDMSVTDIAVSMGFSSASHFIKKFKNVYGVTPRHFKSSIHVDI